MPERGTSFVLLSPPTAEVVKESSEGDEQEQPESPVPEQAEELSSRRNDHLGADHVGMGEEPVYLRTEKEKANHDSEDSEDPEKKHCFAP